MTSRDFVYWLQGFFEIASDESADVALSSRQVRVIRQHLALVFRHEIDPSAGPPDHQAELNAIHEATKAVANLETLKKRPPVVHVRPKPTYRC